MRSMSSTLDPTTSASSEAWKDVLADLLPAQGAWAEEQYLVLTDHASRPVEFTDGLIEPLPMPTDHDQAMLAFLFLAFRTVIEARGGKVRFAPLRLKIRPGKFREPDLLVLVSANDSRRQNRFWTGADLVLEIVSEDNPERDLVQKRADYAEARIPEYWLVHPQAETITVLQLQNGSYVAVGVFRRGQTATAVTVSGLAADVSAVLDAD